MDERMIGDALRTARIRRGLTQAEVAATAGVSRIFVSRLERGGLTDLALGGARRVAGALEMRLDAVLRWRGGEVVPLVHGRHGALHEAALRWLGRYPGWQWLSEVTFAVYGERGAIDIVGWHEDTRTLLIVEVKPDLLDPAGTVGQVDRYRRLARAAVRERGWRPAAVASWVIVAESRTNRRRLARFASVLRTAFPGDGRALQRWLRRPLGEVHGLICITVPEAVGRRRIGRGRSRG